MFKLPIYGTWMENNLDKLYLLPIQTSCRFLVTSLVRTVQRLHLKQITVSNSRWWLQGVLYWYEFILIPAWLSNHINHQVWNEITAPCPNYNGVIAFVNKYFHPTIYRACEYLSSLSLDQSMLEKGAQGILTNGD